VRLIEFAGGILCLVVAFLIIATLVPVATSRRTMLRALAIGYLMFFGGCGIALLGVGLMIWSR
jgi:hypothetical protein